MELVKELCLCIKQEWFICRDRKMENNFKKLFNFYEEQIIFNKFRRTNYTLYHNYKILIYSHALREFATNNI